MTQLPRTPRFLSARELADCFHFLGLAELRLGNLTGGGLFAQSLIGGDQRARAVRHRLFQRFGSFGLDQGGAAGGTALGDGLNRQRAQYDRPYRQNDAEQR